VKAEIFIEGAMVERALTRLAVNGVRVEKVQRLSPTLTQCVIDGKEWERVRKIFPKKSVGAYTVRLGRKVGVFAPLLALCKRTGLVLGGLLFLLLTLCSEAFLFKVEIRTDTPLQTEIRRVLNESGMRPFRLYREGEKESVCAQLNLLRGVSFCSIKKVGSVLVVEVRGNSFVNSLERARVFSSERTGTILSLVVLRGQALLAVGETAQAGQALAVCDKEGDFVVARARLACKYEELFEETDEERAYAKALLAVYGDGVKITNREIKREEEGVLVKIEYEYSYSINYTED
jgi:hypothetical protein